MSKSCTANERWALLYSTLGYESKGAKRIWLRPLRPADMPRDGSPVGWELRNQAGEVISRGEFGPAEHLEDLVLLEADISACTEPGVYSLAAIAGSPAHDHLATLPFPIGPDLFLQRTLVPMALEGAKSREAPAGMGGGYYDSNLAQGDVGAHATFAVGLMHTLVSRGRHLTALERAQLLWAIDRAVDYVMACCNEHTGRIAQAYHRRKQSARPASAADGAAGLWALATYADVFRGDSPARARRAWHLSLAAEKWLQETGLPYPPALECTVNAAFWWHSGHPAFLEKALRAAQTNLATLEEGHNEAMPDDIMPRFEGLYWLWQRLSNDKYLAAMIERVGGLIRRKKGASQGEKLALCPVPWLSGTGPGATQSPQNERILSTAIDALYLAQMLQDPSLAEIASRLLSWIGGLHLGVPGEMVENPPSQAPLESAALLLGIDARRVSAPQEWFWPRNRVARLLAPILALVGKGSQASHQPPTGLVSVVSMAHEQAGTSSQASIGQDGLWLHAACMHGDYFSGSVPQG